MRTGSHLSVLAVATMFACLASPVMAQTPALMAGATAQGPCATDEVRKLGFLIGDWQSATTDVAPEGGSHGNGINHIEGIRGGCAIIQHRYEEKDGKKLFDSVVLWAFDAATNRLREFVVSDDEHAQVFEGMWENDGWVFYRDRIGTADQMWLLRVRYRKSDRGFLQIAELTKDRGKTWVTASSTEYVPAPR